MWRGTAVGPTAVYRVVGFPEVPVPDGGRDSSRRALQLRCELCYQRGVRQPGKPPARGSRTCLERERAGVRQCRG